MKKIKLIKYVECTENIKQSAYILGKIYKTSNIGMIEDPNGRAIWKYNQYRFKPSTKEAYDAQFVVKEPEFVLPKIWWVRITKENLKDISKFLNFNLGENTIGLVAGMVKSYKDSVITKGYNSTPTTSYGSTFGNEITFEQFKKYVLKEQLEEAKDKVLKCCHKNTNLIKQVESSEGAIYQLGDKITVFTKESPNKGKVFTIEKFRWSKDKSKICPITEIHKPNGIGLDKIELYSEPVVKELSLLEQAKLKYPIGTKVKSLYTNAICTIARQSHLNYINSDGYCKASDSIWFTAYPQSPLIYKEGKWAEIVEDFKLPETWWITIENEKQLEIAKQYFNQYFTTGFKTLQVVNNIGFVRPVNWTSNTHMFNLTEETKRNNPQITFEQFEQHVLHNGFKVGDKFSKQKDIFNNIINVIKKEIIDLQYINGQSVAFYKIVENDYSEPSCRILTKNIVK